MARHYGGSRLTPVGDCPPEVARRINIDCERIKQLAMRGRWCQVQSILHSLQMFCLEFQPSTLDPYESAIADHTELSGQLRARLASIGVFFLGQLESITREQLDEMGITPQSQKQLKKLCRLYGIKLISSKTSSTRTDNSKMGIRRKD